MNKLQTSCPIPENSSYSESAKGRKKRKEKKLNETKQNETAAPECLHSVSGLNAAQSLTFMPETPVYAGSTILLLELFRLLRSAALSAN